jgi:L-malate glycosyltransferase
MQRPVIAYVVNSLDPGGTERLVVEMALALQKRYRIVVYCLDTPGQWAARLREAGILVRCLWRQPGLDVALAARMARCLRLDGVELLHAHQCTPWFYGALARYLRPSTSLLLQEHGRFFPEPDRPLRRAFNRLLVVPRTRRFVAVSADVADRLARYEGVPRARVEVVHNGTRPAPALDPGERDSLRQEFGVAADEVLVGTVGRMDPIKNLPMLVEALRTAGPRFRCLFVGDGPERAGLEQLVRERGLAGRCAFAGFREDAARIVQCLDVFVLCSFSEGISVALLEAMAGGVAPVVTRVGGNPDVVADDSCGWVVPNDDAVALAAALLEAAEPEVRRQRARGAQARYALHFSFEGMIAGYDAIYRQVIGARGDPAS